MQRLMRVSRSDLLWTLSSFAVLQLGFAVLVEYGLLPIRDPHYGFAAKHLRQRLLSKADRSFTVVMLGSSRVQYGLEAAALERQLAHASDRPLTVFNFGMSGAGPINNLVMLRRCCADGIRPDLLLVEVLPSLLANTDGCPAEAHYAAYDRYSLSELDVLAHYGFPITGIRREWIENWPLPFHVHRAKIQTILRGYFGKQIDRCGWKETSRPMVVSIERRRRALEHAKTEHHTYLQTLRIGGSACEALRDLLVLCRQQRIDAAIVWMPEGPTFRSWYPPPVLNQIQTFLAGLNGEFGTPIIDAREWVDEDGFMDSHHLLATGATQFTERLGRDVLLPAIARNQRVDWAALHAPRP